VNKTLDTFYQNNSELLYLTMITTFKHQTTIPLFHQGDCSILALSSDTSFYVEEFYDDGFIAQHHIQNGSIIASRDEDAGQRDIVPFMLPANGISPDRPSKHPLNSSGLRFRGLREEEHLQDWIIPLSLAEKMPLLTALNWVVSPMLILGIAESKVLSQTRLDGEWLVCRRIQLAFALPEARYDELGLAYDYDSRAIHLLHTYTEDVTKSLHESLSFAGEKLQCPMDILYHDSRLILADAAADGSNNRLILWEKIE
jgi:hypothetical protein